MSISKEETAKIAKLARLGLSDKEIETFAGQLSSILDYAASLQKLDLDNVEPTSQVTGLTSVFREDKVKKWPDTDELLKLAPEVSGRQFLVPRVIE